MFCCLPLDFERGFWHFVLWSSIVFVIVVSLCTTKASKAAELNKSVLVKQLTWTKPGLPGAAGAAWETSVSVE